MVGKILKNIQGQKNAKSSRELNKGTTTSWVETID